MSYGVDYLQLFYRAANFVGRIFKGANPGDMPVERPTKFELVVNLRTAKALGLSMPQAVLLRADEVIQWLLFKCGSPCIRGRDTSVSFALRPASEYV